MLPSQWEIVVAERDAFREDAIKAEERIARLRSRPEAAWRENLQDRIANLEAENAQLRDLLREIHRRSRDPLTVEEMIERELKWGEWADA